MKKYLKSILSFLSLTYCLMSHAQTDKGDMIAGGGIDVGYAAQDTVRTFNLNITPFVGYFVVKNLALGSSFGIGLSTDNKTKKRETRIFLNTSFLPFIRYYIGKGKTRYFFQLRGGYLGATSLVGTSSSNLDGWMASGSFGITHFLSRNIALESQLACTGVKYQKTSLNLRFNIALGLAIYFHPVIKASDKPLP